MATTCDDDSRGKFYGEINANFVRARGDYMGVAGALNDNADVTAPVYSYAPNDYGLYNMAGNVSEWVKVDVHRPGTLQDAQEFRPFVATSSPPSSSTARATWQTNWTTCSTT